MISGSIADRGLVARGAWVIDTIASATNRAVGSCWVSVGCSPTCYAGTDRKRASRSTRVREMRDAGGRASTEALTGRFEQFAESTQSRRQLIRRRQQTWCFHSTIGRASQWCHQCGVASRRRPRSVPRSAPSPQGDVLVWCRRCSDTQ